MNYDSDASDIFVMWVNEWP